MASEYQKSEENVESHNPSDSEPSIVKVGVLGSGLMGHGIACVSALSGIEVILVDATREKAEIGFSKIKQILQKRVDKKNFNRRRLQYGSISNRNDIKLRRLK
jgi:3-hydroxyacyl-CoA dehydrogenase/enoyl-CoA hydratase/3-hydroxybutyryl-CoA epimerase